MATRSNSSRERILASAETMILQKGFNATSIEDILGSAAITKGGFFYHFNGKSGLAEALMQRYLRQDDALFARLTTQACELSEDPLHQLLIFLKLLADMMGEMQTTHPGCLVASFTYENQQFNDSIRELMRSGLLSWRAMMVKKIELVNHQHNYTGDVTVDTLADMFTAIIEGGILLARNLENNRILVDQIMAYRSFIRVLYGAN